MDFFEAVKRRRSVRKFTDQKVPDEIISKALEAAILAPNSSNTQTWHFHWIKSDGVKQIAVKNCLSQSAARTAQHLIAVTADPALWRRSHRPLLEWVESVKAPSQVKFYYDKLIPFTYRWGFFNCLAPVKWLISFAVGLFRPMMRGPAGRGDLQEIAMKSAALAAENFVLAISAQGAATCMMEGFDEWRMKRLLRLPGSARIVMVIAVGFESDRGLWGPQMRLPLNQVVSIH